MLLRVTAALTIRGRTCKCRSLPFLEHCKLFVNLLGRLSQRWDRPLAIPAQASKSPLLLTDGAAFYPGRCPGRDGDLTSDEIDPRPAPVDGVPGILVWRAALSSRFAVSKWSSATRWRSSAAFFSSSALLALSFSSSISFSYAAAKLSNAFSAADGALENDEDVDEGENAMGEGAGVLGPGG